MKIFFLLSTFLLMSLSNNQMKDEFEECISKGGDVKTCRMQVRQLVRQEKEKIVMRDKVEKTQQNREELLQKIDESMNSQKYILFDPTTGQQIDTRVLSYLEKRKVSCRVNGGTWVNGECVGTLEDVQYKQQNKADSYLEKVVADVSSDQNAWQNIDNQLQYKEMMRKRNLEFKKMKRKVAKLFNVTVKDIDFYLQSNPQIVYQAIAQIQQQEQLEKMKNQQTLDQAKNIDPDKGQEASKVNQPVQDPNMMLQGQEQIYYPADQAVYE